MFTNAIEHVSTFTRPIHTILRTYGGKKIIPGSATLFFVNEEGYAITCKHVVDVLSTSDAKNEIFKTFKQERDKLAKDGKYNKLLKGLELKYKFTPDQIVQVKSMFLDCIDSMSGFTMTTHPKYDLAIIKFNDFKEIKYSGFARFLKDTIKIKQGKNLCRLGFPFPEFTNFKYNEVTDDIEWTTEGRNHAPRFPIDGMVTRFLFENNEIHGIELSTPGLRGQSGGPLFDQNGIVCGMQSSTKHMHLGFDMVDKEILVNTTIRKVTDYSFMHLGQCVHVDIIKNFLRENKIKFYEEE